MKFIDNINCQTHISVLKWFCPVILSSSLALHPEPDIDFQDFLLAPSHANKCSDVCEKSSEQFRRLLSLFNCSANDEWIKIDEKFAALTFHKSFISNRRCRCRADVEWCIELVANNLSDVTPKFMNYDAVKSPQLLIIKERLKVPLWTQTSISLSSYKQKPMHENRR